MTPNEKLLLAHTRYANAQHELSGAEDEIIALLTELGPFKLGEEIYHKRIADLRKGATRGRVKRWKAVRVLPSFRTVNGVLAVKYQAQILTPMNRGRFEVIWSDDYSIWPGWTEVSAGPRGKTRYI